MNGDRFLLDTNAVIYFLRGDIDLIPLLSNANWVGVSIISFIEFLAFPNISKNDEFLFQNFIERIQIIGLESNDNQLIETTIKIRKEYKLKLPDAIFASTAIENNATIISVDNIFQSIDNIQLYNPTISK